MAQTTKHICECDPVTVGDINDRLGFALNTIAIYQGRGLLPEARWVVAGRISLWCWVCDILPWDAARSNRAPENQKKTRPKKVS